MFEFISDALTHFANKFVLNNIWEKQMIIFVQEYLKSYAKVCLNLA